MLKSPNISMLSNFYNCFLSVSGASLIICFQNFQNPEKLYREKTELLIAVFSELLGECHAWREELHRTMG